MKTTITFQPAILAGAFVGMMTLSGCASDDDAVEVKNPVETTIENNSKEEPTEEETPQTPDQDNPNANKPEESYSSPIFGLTRNERQDIAASNDFAFNLFRNINNAKQQQGKDCIISPISLTYVLGMLNTGATGDTQKEICNLLGFGNDDKEGLNALCKKMIDKAPTADEAVKLQLANCIAIDKSAELEDQYKKETADSYSAEVASLEFDQQSAVDYVNDWCNRHTGGMIPKIVDKLNGVMALMNATYFKGPWSCTFDPKETADESFTREDGTRLTVPMMHRQGAAYYAANKQYKTLGMPYGKGRNWLFYALLPNEGYQVDDIIASLSNQSWEENIHHIKSYIQYQAGGNEVDIKMPRFKVESEVTLNDILSTMGAASMFANKGEFTLISKNYKDLFVDVIRQKAAIEVTEEGTEAAALTIAEMDGDDGDGVNSIPKFYATRPFIYMIQEMETGAIFFMGVYRGI